MGGRGTTSIAAAKNYQPAVRVMAPFSLRCDRMPNDACNAVSRSLGLVVVKRPPSRMRDSNLNPSTFSC